MDDSSMWVADEAAPRPSTSVSSSHPRFLRQSKRQTIDEDNCEKRCAHCERRVKKLIFTHACTYECALALAMFDRCQYDYVYTMITIECMTNRDVMTPLPAPPIHTDEISPVEYWKAAIEELYGKYPLMQEFLRTRLRENGLPAREDVNKRRR